MEPIEVAGCVLLDDYGRILLLHRDLGEIGQWELPGGKVEEGETPEQAAGRELGEELGVTVRIGRALGSEVFEQADKQYRFYWFKADIITGEPSIMEPDIFDDLDYFEIEDLVSLSLSTNMQIMYQKIFDGSLQLDA
ncbi:MAG: hydrolase [Candidatus Saccharibacteria bacterium]|nr:hydrolase [Candidatus Saccharibacteria bacterium]